MKETLRAAVVGLGSRGLSLLKTIQSVKDLNIVAVCDFMEERLKAGVDEMRALGVETQGYTDYRRIIERGDIDHIRPDGAAIAPACGGAIDDRA